MTYKNEDKKCNTWNLLNEMDIADTTFACLTSDLEPVSDLELVSLEVSTLSKVMW